MCFSFLAAARPPLARTEKSKLESQTELRGVREVEELAAKLELHLFADREFLGEREIDVVDAVGAKIGEVARRIPGGLGTGSGEARGVEERGIAGAVEEIRSGLMVADTGGNLRADHIGTLVAVGESRLRHGDGERLAALESDDRGDGPTTDDAFYDAVHVSADPAIAADGNIDDRSEDEAMRRVVGADGVL